MTTTKSPLFEDYSALLEERDHYMHEWADAEKRLRACIKRYYRLKENEDLIQQIREIEHYYADSGSDQVCARTIVKVLRERFPWLKERAQ